MWYLTLVWINNMFIPISVSHLETLLCNCLLCHPWRCAIHPYCRRELPQCGQLTAFSAASLRPPSASPSGHALLVLGICGHYRLPLGAVSELLSLLGWLTCPDNLFTFPLSQGSWASQFGSFSAFSWSHSPWSLIGIILKHLTFLTSSSLIPEGPNQQSV